MKVRVIVTCIATPTALVGEIVPRSYRLPIRVVGSTAQTMALPPGLKGIQPYLVTAKQFDKRDPIVSYYCRFLFLIIII